MIFLREALGYWGNVVAWARSGEWPGTVSILSHSAMSARPTAGES